ncbi:neutral zinc metallopeptidase [Arthrobacter sp. TE12232]
MDQAPAGAAPPQIKVSPTDEFGYTVEEYLDFIIRDLDKKWSNWFVSQQLPEPWITIEKVEPGTTVTTKCDANPIPADYNNAFYCAADADGRSDGSLVLPVSTFQKMWVGDIFQNNSKELGDFAAAIITAHEFGHHVQNAIYLENNAAHPDAQFPVLAHGNVNKELIADCFAGVWMASTYYDGLLQPGDYDEAVAALESIGDTVASNDPHGTPEQRKEALLAGYNGIEGQTNSGDPLTCIATYWK